MGFRLAFHGARFMWLCHNLPAVTKTENRDSVTVSQILTMSESRASVRLSAMGRINVSVISMVLWKHNSSWSYSAKQSDFSEYQFIAGKLPIPAIFCTVLLPISVVLV